jgi:hypothetical protein
MILHTFLFLKDRCLGERVECVYIEKELREKGKKNKKDKNKKKVKK